MGRENRYASSISISLLSAPADSRTATLQRLLIGAIVIAGLYFGREVLLPLALAILLSFVLTPPLLCQADQAATSGSGRHCSQRYLAIILVLGWVISREVTQLASNLPSYHYTLSEKIKAFRESTARSPTLERAGEVLSELQEELTHQPRSSPRAFVERGSRAPDDKPIQVEIRELSRPDLSFFRRTRARYCRLSPPPASCCSSWCSS